MQSSLTDAQVFGDDNDIESYDEETEITEDEYQQQLFRREDMTIADLPDSERDKVSRLVDKLVSLGRDHEKLIADLSFERSQRTEEVLNSTRKLQKSSKDFELEKHLMREQMTELQSKHRSGLRLLHLYQVSLENFLKDNCALKDALLARTKNINGDSDSAHTNCTRELDSARAIEMKSTIARLEALSSSQQAIMEIVQSDNRTLTADYESINAELMAATNNLKLSDEMLADCRKQLEVALASQSDNTQHQRDASTMEVACEGMARQLAEMFVRAEERDREIEMYKQSSRLESLLHSTRHSSSDGGSACVAPDLHSELYQVGIDVVRSSNSRSSQNARGEGRIVSSTSSEEQSKRRTRLQHVNLHSRSSYDDSNSEINNNGDSNDSDLLNIKCSTFDEERSSSLGASSGGDHLRSNQQSRHSNIDSPSRSHLHQSRRNDGRADHHFERGGERELRMHREHSAHADREDAVTHDGVSGGEGGGGGSRQGAGRGRGENGLSQALNNERHNRQVPHTDTHTDIDRDRSIAAKNAVEEERGMDRTRTPHTSVERSSAVSNENGVDRRTNSDSPEEFEGRREKERERERVSALDNSQSSSTMSVRFSQSLSHPQDLLLLGNRRMGGQFDGQLSDVNHRQTSSSSWAERVNSGELREEKRQSSSSSPSSSALRASQTMPPKTHTHSHDRPYSHSSPSYRKPLPVYIRSSTNSSMMTTNGITNHAKSIKTTGGKVKEKRKQNQSVEETKSERKERGLLSFDCARDGYDPQLFDLLDSIETNSQERH